MNARIDRLRATLEEPLLVLDPTNVRYLTGFVSSNSAVVVEADRVRLFSDFRYASAGRGIEGAEFVETERALVKAVAALLHGRIAFEADFVTYSAWETLAQGNLELVPRSGLVERLRAVKDERELETIRQATEITTEALTRFSQERFTGKSEKELAWRLEQLLRELGAEAMAFEPAVASGPNGASPHTDPTDRVVSAGDTIVVDAGAQLEGYCSDCTRTFVAGALQGPLAGAYGVVLEAQQAGLDATRAAVVGRDADAAARAVVTQAGFGEAFGHGLGHGVGLKIHEAPRLAQTSEDVLEPGNVVTVEPGIYLEGVGGIRIEDLVVVTDGRPEILTSFTKQIVTVE